MGKKRKGKKKTLDLKSGSLVAQLSINSKLQKSNNPHYQKSQALQKKKEKENEKRELQKIISKLPKVKLKNIPPFRIHYKRNDNCEKIYKVFLEVLSNDQKCKIDEPIINYVCSIIEKQSNQKLKIKEEELKKLLLTFFNSLNFEEKVSNLLFSRFFEKLKENNMLFSNIPPKREEIKKLSGLLSFERTLEEEKFNEEDITVDLNFNEEINWDEEKLRQIEEKRFLKKQKVAQKKKRIYEQYLKDSGLSKSKGLVRIHKKSNVGGSLNVKTRIESLSIGSLELLADTELILTHGVKYGLVGRNGVGKTTLLRGISERDLEDIPINLQILHVEQEVDAADLTPIECLLQTDMERENLIKEEEEILNGKEVDDSRLQEIYDRMNQIDAHSAEARACEILAGLSFTPDMQKSKISRLSGGWRKRVSIARSLYIEPDILLLDEPTNHLDLHAVLFLEMYLQKFKNTVVLVSHSKDFLNNVAQSIIHFHDKKLNYYKGNYYKYENTRRASMLNMKRAKEAQEKQKSHIQSFIDKFRYKTKTAGLVQSRIKALKKMTFIPSLVEDSTFQFSFPQPEKISGTYFQLINLEFGYSRNSVLFSNVNLLLRKDARIALIGANGVGKTTLFNLIQKKLNPSRGEVQTHPNLESGFFKQHHSDQLDLAFSSIEFMKKKFPKAKEYDIRSQLSRMGLKEDTHLQPIYTLSGGQKSRVVFAELTFSKPNLLLLDEPTNHLDMDTIDALVNALNEYEGCVIIISHDSYLIKRVCDEIFILEKRRLKKFNGSFEDYKKSLML